MRRPHGGHVGTEKALPRRRLAHTKRNAWALRSHRKRNRGKDKQSKSKAMRRKEITQMREFLKKLI